MKTVSCILKTKSNTTFSISPGTTVYKALEMMVDKNVGALLVTENGRILGLFTERDYARKVILKGKSSKETLIREIMIKDPVTITPNHTIDECMRLMTTRYIRHLPVVENDTIVGIISMGDLVKQIMEDQKFLIDHMEHYITGG
jgi:CBS domain-containing protein